MSTGTAETAWRSGRLDGRAGPPRLLFGRTYEDAAIELRAFPPGGRVLCIAAAGDTALALAPYHEVVAVDVNPRQIEYVRQRLAGGASRRGTVDCLLALGHSLAPLIGWRPSVVRRFLDLENPEEQLAFWHRELDTWRFRRALEGLFSAAGLRHFYRQSFRDCLPAHPAAVFRQRMERCFARHSNRGNPYARLLLLGKLDAAPLPPETRGVQVVHAEIAAYLEGQAPASFHGFTLSNILDGAGVTYGRKLAAAVVRAAAPGARVVLRSFREPEGLRDTNHAAEDRSLLWGVVDVRLATSFRQRWASSPVRVRGACGAGDGRGA